MRRVAAAAAALVAAVVAVGALGDLTQSRPDPLRDDAVTEVVVSVEHDRYVHGAAGAAAALWAACAGQTRSRPTEGLRVRDDGRYRVVLAPAVGEHEERKLRGCLEDLTVERVLGDVESWRTLAAG